MMLRTKFPVLDETMDGSAGGGGGGDGGLNIDMAAAVEEIGAGLGLGTEKGEGEDTLDGSATPSGEPKPKPAAAPTPEAGAEARQRAEAAAKAKTDLDAAKKVLTDKKLDFTGKKDEEILALAKENTPAPKAMPKAWKKEVEAQWAKLDPAAQDYILQREAEVEAGFKANSSAVKYATEVYKRMDTHKSLFATQGITNHVAFLENMIQSHVVLSSMPDDKRYPYMASILKTYGLDPAKVAEAFAAGPVQHQETQAERENRLRIEKLEGAHKNEQEHRIGALKAQAAAEVEAFASDPAHSYFRELEPQIALLLADPSITLEKAYEMAVYANPVTRAKELERVQKDADAKARKEAEEKAAAAAKARGTRVRGEERHRASPDLLGSMEDTMRETLKDIHSRT